MTGKKNRISVVTTSMMTVSYTHLDAEGLVGFGGRGQAGLAHQAHRVGGQEHLAGDLLVVHVALDLAPALHLRQDPHLSLIHI